VRETIVEALGHRLTLTEGIRNMLCGSADALDAVLCALAAIAVTENRLAYPPAPQSEREGWIAVHV